jgi:hypothetical protein
MSPATIANIGDIHVDAYANSSSPLSRRGLEKRAFPGKINKIWCGYSGGGLADYDEGKEKWNRFVESKGGAYKDFMFEGSRYFLQNSLCDGVEGGLCDFLIDTALDVPGWLYGDEVADFFDGAFDAVRKECKETGGAAELIADPPAGNDVCGIPTCTADGKMALKIADFQAQFFVHDSGATCPANPPPTNWCEVSSFN